MHKLNIKIYISFYLNIIVIKYFYFIGCENIDMN